MGRHKRQSLTGPAQSLADQRSRILGLTQEEMARRLKCSQPFLSQVECGYTTPTNLKRWAREYRMSMKRFNGLMDNQFCLPLWKFAYADGAGDTVAIGEVRKVDVG